MAPERARHGDSQRQIQAWSHLLSQKVSRPARASGKDLQWKVGYKQFHERRRKKDKPVYRVTQSWAIPSPHTHTHTSVCPYKYVRPNITSSVIVLGYNTWTSQLWSKPCTNGRNGCPSLVIALWPWGVGHQYGCKELQAGSWTTISEMHPWQPWVQLGANCQSFPSVEVRLPARRMV